MLEQAREQADQAGDASGVAQALNGLGMVAHHENLGVLMGGSARADPDVAAEEQLFRAALAQAEQAGHAAATAQSLFGLGLVFQVLRRDWNDGNAVLLAGAGAWSRAPDTQAGPYLRSEVHRHLGFYFGYEDVQPAEAVRHLQISLDLREGLGEPRYLPSALVALGEVELSAGHADRAADLLGQGRRAGPGREAAAAPHRRCRARAARRQVGRRSQFRSARPVSAQERPRSAGGHPVISASFSGSPRTSSGCSSGPW